MRGILLFLLISLAILPAAKGQDTQSCVDICFRVQVAASTKPLMANDQQFKDFADLEAIRFPDGYYRYFTGKFETYFAAQEHLETVKAKGYAKAFVLALQGLKRMTPDEAIELIYAN
ncbi:MAG: hypothetical protein SFW35_13530 [Chitinophagales bacterium]|nr:hypothetical protein [Chitinophagales bacterium]